MTDKLIDKQPKSSANKKDNWSEYNEARKNELSQLFNLFQELKCEYKELILATRGCPLPAWEILFCIVLKIYFCKSSSRTCSILEELKIQDYLPHIPHKNSLTNYLNLESLTPHLLTMIEMTSLRFRDIETNFAIDSTKLKIRGTHIRKDKKGRKEKKCNYVMLHAICGYKTHIVSACAVTTRFGSEQEFFQPLLDDTLRNFKVALIAGDKNYSSEKNMQIAEERGVKPCLTPKKNFVIDSNKNSEIRCESIRKYREGNDEDLQPYRDRKRIETVFSMIKARSGDNLLTRRFRSQVNEALTMVLCHNLCVLNSHRKLWESETNLISSEQISE
jgi:transposase